MHSTISETVIEHLNHLIKLFLVWKKFKAKRNNNPITFNLEMFYKITYCKFFQWSDTEEIPRS